MTRLARSLTVAAFVGGVFCTPLFLHLGTADQENDEAIYSYAAESLVETGDWMNPRFSPNPDVVFVEKPPLKFWLVALPIRAGILPDNDFGLRFCDAAFGSLAFFYVFAFGRRMGGWVCGAIALLVLFTFETLLVQHGLRGNNMEAALVLAYAGAAWHFLRWAEGAGGSHAWAVGLYFVLGFMTKFVAVLFLPAILAAAALELPGVRARAARHWRNWAVVGCAIIVCVAPWFVYQMLQPGRGLWTVMVSEHVLQRFQSSVDPAHVKPWDFYFRSLSEDLWGRRTFWIVLSGGLLVHTRVLRQAWLPGTLVVYWFWMPFLLMSLGTSKLWHYAYPFLAPVALAGGYLVASAAAALGDLASGRPLTSAALPEVAGALNRAFAWWSGRSGRLVSAPRWIVVARHWAQRVLMAAAVVFLVLGGLSLIHPGRFNVIGVGIRPQPALRAGLIAIALAFMGGRTAWLARAAVPLILVSFMSVPQYLDQIARMRAAASPVRTSRNCVAEVRQEERAAGRPLRDMLVYLPNGFLHPFFFYYRHVGWDWRNELEDAELFRSLDDPAAQRPVLLPAARFLEAGRPGGVPNNGRPPLLRVSESVVLLLPGPYARCAP